MLGLGLQQFGGSSSFLSTIVKKSIILKLVFLLYIITLLYVSGHVLCEVLF